MIYFIFCPQTILYLMNRIIPGFMLQGGDITTGNGMGGESIYGGSFADEPFTVKHKKYSLSMANRGDGKSNSSQFFITFAPTDWLNGKHNVFGEVLEGFDVVDQVEKLGSRSGKPSTNVRISDSGEIKA
jgi:peptidylprolyl isomerase